MAKGKRPFFPDPIDFYREGIEVVVTPRSVADQSGHHLSQRSVEERLQVLVQRRPPGDGPRHGRRVEISQPILPMFPIALHCKSREHHAHR